MIRRRQNFKRLMPMCYAWFLVACAGISGIAPVADDGAPAMPDADSASPAIVPAPMATAAVVAPALAPAAEPRADASLATEAVPEPAPSMPAGKPALRGTAGLSSAAHIASNAAATMALHNTERYQPGVDVLCEQIGNKLGSVSVEDCLKNSFVFGGGFSVNQRPLVIKEYQPVEGDKDDFRVLIMGGIHGDEYSSISILFKWLALFSPQSLEGEFYWRFAPLVNPDGLLDGQAKRQNANGVDLNRNFPSQDWNAGAAKYWQESTGSNPRRFPGSAAASEPEVRWVVEQIEAFQPDVIVSVHAPYHLLDFDGPARAPNRIGELYLHQLGVYPGSLGNFAGLNRSIPVVTLELPSAGIMPPTAQISLMWQDLVAWLDREGRKDLMNQGVRTQWH
jgi:hypothetical protein